MVSVFVLAKISNLPGLLLMTTNWVSLSIQQHRAQKDTMLTGRSTNWWQQAPRY
jgi:hypothetical protein